MKLSTALSLFGLALGATTFAIAQGCSSDSTDPGGGGQTGKVPPAAEGPPTTSSDERTFALHTLQLGEADRSGKADKDAWKKYGYNLDNRVTNATNAQSPDLQSVCKRVQGAQAVIHQDGEEGTDNSFGKTILPLLAPFTPTPSKSLDEAIQKGDFTILLSIKGLTEDASQTNTGLSGTLRVGGSFSEDDTKKPTFTTADDWPFLKEPQVPINGAYINKGTFVNGAGGASINLALSISGQTLSLTINKAIVTFKHNPANKEITEGTIAGVINTQEFVTGIGSIAGRFDKTLCSGSTVESIKDSIRQASDMMADGSQNPGADCTGISIGLGFTGKQVANPTKTAPESTPPPDPCKETPDAGPDANTPADGGQDSGDASDQ